MYFIIVDQGEKEEMEQLYIYIKKIPLEFKFGKISNENDWFVKYAE